MVNTEDSGEVQLLTLTGEKYLVGSFVVLLTLTGEMPFRSFKPRQPDLLQLTTITTYNSFG